MAVLSYLRVSTDRQAEEGESLGAQQRQVEGYAMMIGLTVDHHFIERGVSGSIPLKDRPEGGKLLDLLKAGDTVITPKLDRCFRSSLDALETLGKLKDRGVSLHMIDLGGDVTNNGVSKLVFTILSAVAEAERDRTRERIKDVKADQKRRSRFLGGSVPFGFRVDDEGALVVDEVQQKAIQTMIKLKLDGYTLRGIAGHMEQHEGIKISHETVSQIIKKAKDRQTA
jgi:DNA invertase Pin-like site-specific DNA recombinase